MASGERERLLLVEHHAHQVGGHWHATLLRLAAAARRQGNDVSVAALHGMPDEIQGELGRLGVTVLTRPQRGDAVGWLFQVCALACAATCAATSAIWRRRAFPYQFSLVARCLTEGASLRSGGRADTAVVLTASEGLHALPALLSGRSHVRIVHDVYSRPGRVLRRAERCAVRRAPRVVTLCPTRGVATDLLGVFPWLTPIVRPFAVTDPLDRVGDAERRAAKARHGVAGTVPVACLAGGWWPHKDMGTVERALRAVRRPIIVLVAGVPLDQDLLCRMRSAPKASVIVTDRALSEAEMRDLYAACDLTIVSRYPGFRGESGVIADAIQYGVSLVCSDHNPALSVALDAADWATVFPAQDAAALAAILDRLADQPLARPSAEEAGRLGVRTAAAAVEDFSELAHEFTGSGR